MPKKKKGNGAKDSSSDATFYISGKDVEEVWSLASTRSPSTSCSAISVVFGPTRDLHDACGHDCFLYIKNGSRLLHDVI